MINSKILTVDLEDWFHILDHASTAEPSLWSSFESRVEFVTVKLLKLFDDCGVSATFFILGWIAEEYPELVRQIRKQGHEIACHSHHHQLVYSQSHLEFEKDLIRATDAIEKATGIRPTAYRAPGFSIRHSELWAFRVLSENGYKIDCSVFPAKRAHGGIPGFPARGPCILNNSDGSSLLSMPINVKKGFGSNLVYSGGGYFRILPYWLLRGFFHSDPYVMTYFHPRDFDPDQPMLHDLSAIRKFKSYVGLSRSFTKLKGLLLEMEFLTVSDAVELHYEQNMDLPVINLDN